MSDARLPWQNLVQLITSSRTLPCFTSVRICPHSLPLIRASNRTQSCDVTHRLLARLLRRRVLLRRGRRLLAGRRRARRGSLRAAAKRNGKLRAAELRTRKSGRSRRRSASSAQTRSLPENFRNTPNTRVVLLPNLILHIIFLTCLISCCEPCSVVKLWCRLPARSSHS